MFRLIQLNALSACTKKIASLSSPLKIERKCLMSCLIRHSFLFNGLIVWSNLKCHQKKKKEKIRNGSSHHFTAKADSFLLMIDFSTTRKLWFEATAPLKHHP